KKGWALYCRSIYQGAGDRKCVPMKTERSRKKSVQCRRPSTRGRSSRLAADVPSIPDHELIRCIGKGSYGEVWLARSIIGTYRAVKVVRRKSFSDERPYEREFAGLKRFEPISRTHPGFISILHIGRNDRSRFFYCIMEIADDLRSGRAISPGKYAPRTLASELTRRGGVSPGGGGGEGSALSPAPQQFCPQRTVPPAIQTPP